MSPRDPAGRRAGAARAARLLLGARVRRLWNRLRLLRAPAKAADGPGARQATAPKQRSGGWGALFVVLMTYVAVSTSATMLGKLERAFPSAGGGLPAPALAFLTAAVGVLMAAALLLALSNKELATPEWDLEWLCTLPVPLRALLAVRVLERAINPLGVLAVPAFLSVLAWRAGHGWLSPLLGIALAAPLLLVLGALEVAIELGLRLRVSPPRVRNAQALFTVAGTVLLYVALAPVYARDLADAWQAATPAWLAQLPPGLAVRALARGGDPGIAVPLLLVEALACVTLAVALAARALRGGVVAGGAREASRHARPPAPLPRRSAPAPAPGEAAGAARRWPSPLQRRELRMLARDRNFLVQTMVMPLLIVALQVIINQGGASRFSLRAMAPTHLAALGFGIAAYTMMFSAFQTLNAEGKALWVLYTLPRSLSSVLRDKALMWAALAWSYPLGLFVAAAVVRGGLGARELALLGVVLVGVPIYALIAVSLGVFGANPLAEEAQRKIKPSYAYLYLLLAALGSYAIYATSLWQRLALLVLTGTLALALWQRARDQLPYLLDPGAAPPARVSLSDGMIAALAFMVLQALVALVVGRRGHAPTGPQVLVSFVVAGGVVALAAHALFLINGVRGAPRVVGRGAGRAVGWGLAAGVVAAAFGVAYLAALPQLAGDWVHRLQQTQLRLPAAGPWLVALAVVAAPVFEEIIFRGLVYGGLRRTLPFRWAALASAAIFAVIHPPAAALPVFVLALAAAWAYERTSLLIAPMLAHALYNGVLVTLQLAAPALAPR